MKRFLQLLICIPVIGFSQSYKVDTLLNASAFTSSFALVPSLFGVASNGDVFTGGFVESFNGGDKANLTFVRIDLTTKKVQYKNLKNVYGGNGYYWIYTMDKAGNFYLSMNTNNVKIIKLNLQDSIEFTDLGNAFKSGTTLAYSASHGYDGNLYFGGGSGGGTYWSEYNLQTQQFEKHPIIDPANDYVMSIAGDKDYVYMQVGQKKNISLWAVNKRTEEKKILLTVSNATRLGLGVYTDGVYCGVSVDTLKGTFKLENGKAVKVDASGLKNHFQITAANQNNIENRKPKYIFFDAAQNKLLYSFDNKTEQSVEIRSDDIKMNIRRVFAFPGDKDNIYFVGDYYGNYYRYNLKEQRSYLLGSMGYNVYSILPLNDHEMFMGGYPSGFLMYWDKNKPWTTQKFMNGKQVQATDSNANPKIIHYWKSEGEPPAGFHHTIQLLNDGRGHIIGAGDVIRIGNAASIGVYNTNTKKLYGLDFTRFNSFKFSSIALWQNNVLYAMKATTAKKPKLWVYDADNNLVKDSIDLGFDDYGKIFVQDNILTGFTYNRIYSYDLTKRKMLWNDSFPPNTIGQSVMLPNGLFVVDTKNKIPATHKNIIAVRADNLRAVDNYVYATLGKQVIRFTFNK